MYDTGSTAFMLVCTMLVLLMTPGLAFFYGGLSRRKNVVNTMLMSFAVIGIVGLTWVLVGWSLAYGGDGSNPVIGGLDQLGLSGVVGGMLDEAQVADGSSYPSVVDVTFQMAFALITTAIITGSVAGRMRFGAVALFVAVWSVVVYAPLAHMVWGGEGSLIGGIIGALDFAGGDVVPSALDSPGLSCACSSARAGDLASRPTGLTTCRSSPSAPACSGSDGWASTADLPSPPATSPASPSSTRLRRAPRACLPGLW